MSSVASSGTAEALKYRAVQSCSGIFGHAPPVNQVGGRPCCCCCCCCCYKDLRSFSPWTSGECATEGAITKSLVACRGERRAGGRARDDDGRRRRRRVGLRLLWVMDAFSRRVTARACACGAAAANGSSRSIINAFVPSDRFLGHPLTTPRPIPSNGVKVGGNEGNDCRPIKQVLQRLYATIHN